MFSIVLSYPAQSWSTLIFLPANLAYSELCEIRSAGILINSAQKRITT